MWILPKQLILAFVPATAEKAFRTLIKQIK